jgi:hypothetical protein
MNAFRLALISENSRLCKMSASPDGAMSIRSAYKTYWGRWPDEELTAIADIARVNAIRGESDRLV